MIRFGDVTVFTNNRQRLLAGDSADAFFVAVLQQARSRDLLSDEHFTVDGTLLEAQRPSITDPCYLQCR